MSKNTVNSYIGPAFEACIAEIDRQIEGAWSAINTEQTTFLMERPRLDRILSALPEGSVATKASTRAGPVNQFLRENGFDIALCNNPNPAIYAAAILKLALKWAGSASPEDVAWLPTATTVPGVRLKSHFVQQGNEVRLATRTADIDVVLVPSSSLRRGLSEARKSHNEAPEACGSCSFPKVSLNREIDLNCFLGMRRGGFAVSEVLAQAKATLDEFGSEVEVAAAVCMARGLDAPPPPKSFDIDGPFTVIYEVNGEVALAFHITEEDLEGDVSTDEAPPATLPFDHAPVEYDPDAEAPSMDPVQDPLDALPSLSQWTEARDKAVRAASREVAQAVGAALAKATSLPVIVDVSKFDNPAVDLVANTLNSRGWCAVRTSASQYGGSGSSLKIAKATPTR